MQTVTLDDLEAAVAREHVARAPRALDLRRVLVAEDNGGMLRLISRALRRSGHEVLEARNGFELMHWVDLMTQGSQQMPLVDLVITDHRMPMFSGLECLQQLHFGGNRTPVILISAFSDERLRQMAMAHGARKVLDKPIDLDALCAEADRILS